MDETHLENLLRELGRIPLPMTVLVRFDWVLAPTKAAVITQHLKAKGGKRSTRSAAGQLDLGAAA